MSCLKKKKFLIFQVLLIGTNTDRDLGEEAVKRLNYDCEKRIELYDPMFGDIMQVRSAEDNTIVLTGEIRAYTSQGCKGLYADFKYIAKKYFHQCKKTRDLMVMEGDCIF
ncbi:MAG: hypothetical protein K0R00_142 [Herbinix sp.]|jgi:hypothetical protein|nr:hypothetical protein [Herbinix sp.]